MKNVPGQKEASKSCLPQHGCPLPSLCTEKLISLQPDPLDDLWMPAQWPMPCGMLLSPPLPWSPSQRERKEGDDVAGSHSRSRHVRAFPAQAVGNPAWKRQLKSRGGRSSLGQVPCGQEKPTLRLQVVTGRKTPLSLCKIGLCWPCLAAWFHCLKSVLTRHRQSNASCLFLHQCSVLQPVTVNFCSLCHPSSPPLRLPRVKL